MKKILTFAIVFAISNMIIAQINPKKCITTNIVQEELQHNTEYQLKIEELSNYYHNHTDINHKSPSTITIPVVVHIIHRNSHSNIGTGTNISDAQIQDQLRILNEDYSKTNPEFPNPPRNTFVNYAGNPDIQFCLASIDPDGNSTTGVTRTSSSKASWDADDDDEKNYMKLTSQGGNNNWDPLRYLNIWVCNLANSSGGGQTLGYAYLPGLQNGNQSWKDGLVVDYQQFGTIGSANLSDGRTPTHEIGHYLGLSHTFCENTDSQGNPICCDNDQNPFLGVDDTPASKDIYYGAVNATTNNNTCNDISYQNIFTTNVLDMDENYMSYAATTWMFSDEQANVMQTVLNASTSLGGRKMLWQNSPVTVDCITSTQNNPTKRTQPNIFPNPTKGKLYFDATEKKSTISINNIIGEEVISNIPIRDNQINISNLKNGIYFIHIYSDKEAITKKIILSK